MPQILGKIFRPRKILTQFWVKKSRPRENMPQISGKQFRPREIIPQIWGKKFRGRNFFSQIRGRFLPTLFIIFVNSPAQIAFFKCTRIKELRLAVLESDKEIIFIERNNYSLTKTFVHNFVTHTQTFPRLSL